MKRLFAAIKIIPDDVFLELFYKMKRQLKDEKIKWVDPGNVHITLKFFGETDEEKIPEIIDVMNKTSQHSNPFSISIKNVGLFGSTYKPRVIWFGIEENKELLNLGHTLLEKFEGIGFQRDRQNFRPHLTIGRIKYIEDKKRLNDILQPLKDYPIQKSDVHEMFLFESILKPTGPEYRVIETIRFQ
ncbi:MAG: RNA 2',3'-cyclic phosphodiesterase [Bacteroidetes bacterium]|nr:RNA 2',3'-cyclic phosphodiesterase [Bacteroidota bacterium]